MNEIISPSSIKNFFNRSQRLFSIFNGLLVHLARGCADGNLLLSQWRGSASLRTSLQTVARNLQSKCTHSNCLLEISCRICGKSCAVECGKNRELIDHSIVGATGNYGWTSENSEVTFYMTHFSVQKW